jgi:hypothetical protein
LITADLLGLWSKFEEAAVVFCQALWTGLSDVVLPGAAQSTASVASVTVQRMATGKSP